MWALVTGASSGIGRDMSRYLFKLGYDLILVARNEEGLNNLKQELENDESEKELSKKILVIPEDLSNKQNCFDLYEKTKNIDIDLLVNNAGFGEFGEFYKTSMEKELNLINTNITAVHILTKLYLQDMHKKIVDKY